ncbi:PD40 domain-containing protein [Occallatibacter savannae]|uniref:PD40 domain-containing protein n=1 Tax=Occallatibacter savannae TaxID=1002691 RepID=UPI0013A57426|nr:PD40 domain-containing protein [Occallatibacter savannae]
MCARLKFALALPLCLLISGFAGTVHAQSVWQKMKQQVLQQQCQQGLQKACQALAKITQNPGQQPAPQQTQGQQPGQPAPPMPGRQPRQDVAQAADQSGRESGPIRPPNGTKVEETVLAPLAPGARFYVSPHGVHVATWENSGSRAVVYYDGVPGPKFDEIIEGIAFSPDGKRVAYCGRSGTEMVVMVDGKELLRTAESQEGVFDSSSCHLGFTSNSRHVYLIQNVRTSTMKGGSFTRFIFDGKAAALPSASGTQSTGEVGGIHPSFSPDGEHYAYVAIDPSDEQKWALVVDGKVAPYRGGGPRWSPDSQHLYTTISHPGAAGYMEGMLDGKPFIRADRFDLHVAPKGGNLWVAVVDAGIRNPSPTQFLVVNGKKVPGSEIVRERGAFIDEVAFSPDGKHYAARYTTTQNHQYLIVDGKRAEEYQKIDNIVFTADSSKVTYTSFSNGKPFAIIGDEESEPCLPELATAVGGSHGGLVIAPVGARAGGICGLNGGEAPTLYLDGKTLRMPDGVRGAGDLRFSADGQHYAYRAGFQGGGMRLVIDNVVQFNSNLGTPSTARYQHVFSPDSKHIASDSAPPTDTGVFASGLFLDGKYIPVVANPGMKRLEFTADSKHIVWAQGAPSRDALRIFVDGKVVADTEAAVAANSPEAWWDMLPDGSLAVLGQDQNNLKRITITPSSETSVAALSGGGALVAKRDQ